MTKQTKLVPKRRFKEFKNNHAWEKRKFDEEVEFYSGLTYSPTNVSKSGTLVLRSSNVKNGEIVSADNVYVKSEIVNSSNVQKGDIIVVVRNGSRSLIGKHAQIKKDMAKTVIGAFMTGIRSQQSNFINTLLDTHAFKAEVDKNLGATINQITNGMFRSMQFLFPESEEQKTIGLLFAQIDQLIINQQHKLEKTKVLKAAYLSEMFPAEGELVPKRRFSGFTQDWEKCRLGEVSPLRGGYAFQSSKFKKNGIPILRISNILPNGTTGGEYAYYEEQDNDNNYTLSEGAALLAMSGATTGKVSILTNLKCKKVYQNQRVGYFSDLTLVDYGFISVIVRSHLFTNQVKSTLVAGAQPNISSKEVNNFLFCIPTKIEEQIKIGNFFKQLDDIITHHQSKLEKLQNLKKAYLHEMFV